MEWILLIVFFIFLFLAFRCYKNKDFKYFGFYLVVILLDFLFVWFCMMIFWYAHVMGLTL
ncbi:hypothetical protein B5E92_00820 [Erysipelatoclostridium sp. An15]|uniref:hypothetical protein n=1 Tax=Erysipelatoclostridium sp. An15 TaxID=1965566 RepID=UPI000B3771B1|nr:hypothetical protein [Erysipelatoclostridium sp. An15]OUQ09346.1 hypothetical protein B5E92_00820 [Erysipelatoclostridium sp. An15]